MKKISFVLLLLFLIVPKGIANNAVVENIFFTHQNIANGTIDIQFDIAWENSWFIAGAPNPNANWDAVWVFAKHSVYSNGAWGDWAHCTLLDTGFVAPTGSQMSFGDTGGVYKGVFIYRSATGSGSVDWDDAEIRWDYRTDGVTDNDVIQVNIFAIEMVYISSGSFYVGDTDGDQDGNLKWQDATPGAPQITDALGNAINCEDTDHDDAQLEGDGIRIDGDGGLDTDADGDIDNANFPTGYLAFYIMKYEFSQRQYCEFLNNLTDTQKGNRTENQFGPYRHNIKEASNGNYGCDASSNAGNYGSANWALMNESNDGEWVSCNFISYMDLAAYADWAGLRPLTGLEFPKACRGGQAAVDDEYSWGNTTVETATSFLISTNTASEVPNQGNINFWDCLPDGPYRVGSYADATSNRTNAGASYYGVLDLSGSLRERFVTIGNATGRAFAGTHGDGLLSTDGHATNSDWPGFDAGEVTGATGSGYRADSWYNAVSWCVVSFRTQAALTSTSRARDIGGRCGRTAP